MMEGRRYSGFDRCELMRMGWRKRRTEIHGQTAAYMHQREVGSAYRISRCSRLGTMTRRWSRTPTTLPNPPDQPDLVLMLHGDGWQG